MISRSRIFLFLIFFQYLTVSCLNPVENDSENNRILTKIESSLGIKNEDFVLRERLLRIQQKVQEELVYEGSVFSFKRQDTIQYGETFEAILIPIRTYEYEIDQKTAISIADSTWSIERPSYDNGLYVLQSNHYKKGKNEVYGVMPIGKDTLQFVFDFMVN